jgi:hypothetical protein
VKSFDSFVARMGEGKGQILTYIDFQKRHLLADRQYQKTVDTELEQWFLEILDFYIYILE